MQATAIQANAPVVKSSSKVLWTGRILSGLVVLFLLVDAGFKLIKPLPAPAVKAFGQLGYPVGLATGIGIVLLGCVALYLIPRTSVLGAILLTGYLGGAVASNVRAGTPLFNMVFPMLFGVMAWASLVLRGKRLESILLKGE